MKHLKYFTLDASLKNRQTEIIKPEIFYAKIPQIISKLLDSILWYKWKQHHYDYDEIFCGGLVWDGEMEHHPIFPS